MDYLIPILLFVGLGILAGVLLTVFSRLFAVEQDERAVQAREALPGANCGACGYAGCDAYAEAVANGARTNACIPGGDAVAKKLSAIMGTAFEDVVEQAAAVRCNGNCGVTQEKYEYAGEMTCEACSKLYGGRGSCPSGCIGLGDCVKVCPFHAISVQNGVAVVDRSLCTGCGLCAQTCPKHLIEIFDATKKVEVLCSSPLNGKATMAACKAGCIGCKKCERTCEQGAIHVENFHAVIDHNKCTNCGACAEGCPTHCIHIL
ncbi:MAG: RnfABCDGE type electron transport complex subunit B [Candidatus Merdivicinus sp.]|jgi:electron transport complex protein RnfB